MATQLKTASFSGGNGSHFYLKLSYDLLSQSIENNTSTIRYYEYVGSKDNYSGSGANGNGYINSNWVGGTGYVGVNSEVYIGYRDETVTHDTNGAKTVNYSASFSFPWNNLKDASLSGTLTLPTIPRHFSRTPILTPNKNNETSFSCSWSTSETCSKIRYSLNNGSTWTVVPNFSEGTSGSFSITSLSANTTYTIKAEFTRKDSSLTTEVSAQQTTYAYPYISAITPAVGSVWEMSGTTQSVGATLYNPLERNVKVYISIGTISGTKAVSFSASTGTSVSATLRKETSGSTIGINNRITNAQSATLVYWCEYSLDGTNYTTNTATLNNTYQLREVDCKPTISNLTYDDGNSITKAVMNDSGQSIIQNQGIVKATVGSATYKSGATFKSMTISLGSVSVAATVNSAATLGKFNYTTGAQTMTATLTDSRGWTATTTKNVTFISYSPPQVNVVAQRTGGYGTNATFTVNASYTALSGRNAWLNSNTAYVRYEISPAPSTPAASGNVANTNPITNKVINITGADNNKTYTITIYANDKITSGRTTATFGQGQPILSVIKDNQTVGINTVTNEDDPAGLYVNGVSKLSGNTTITGNLTNVTGTAKITGTLTTAAISSSGQIKTTNTTASSSTTTGAIVTSGGIGAAKNSYFGGNLNVAGTLTVGSKTLLNWIYPVGSVYISVNSTNPGTLFGGTWERIQDKFLLASGSTYSNGSTGGSAKHKHLTAMGFDTNHFFGYATPITTEYGTEYLPAFDSTILTDKDFIINDGESRHSANLRAAYTDEASTLPPYLAVYVWKRTA